MSEMSDIIDEIIDKTKDAKDKVVDKTKDAKDTAKDSISPAVATPTRFTKYSYVTDTNNQAINTQNMMAKIKDLSIPELSLMSLISFGLKDRLDVYFKIDPFTVPDPFPIKEDLTYFVVVDKSDTDRIISFVAIKKDFDDSSLWDVFLGKEMSRLDLSPKDILSLKQELLPKETNNFYPLRKDGSIAGFIAFAFEICGKKYPPSPT